MRQLIVVLSLSALAGCTTGGRGDPDAGPQPVTDSGSRDGGGTTQHDAGPAVDGGPRIDDVLIYAHSRDTLYAFSAYTNTVSVVGPFHRAGDGAVPDMVDLAVDSEGVVFTSSQGSSDEAAAIWLVDPLTAEVSKVGDIALDRESFYALTFLAPEESPDGTEMLIGATNEGVCYEIDRDTAQISMLGTYPDGWVSSGDIVSIDGLGTYATLKRDGYPDDAPIDVVAKITFASDGILVDEIGDGICPPSSSAFCPGGSGGGGAEPQFRRIFGLGYWGENLYGFSASGQLIRIDKDTGRGEVVSTTTGSEEFWGAGVTVDVPFLF